MIEVSCTITCCSNEGYITYAVSTIFLLIFVYICGYILIVYRCSYCLYSKQHYVYYCLHVMLSYLTADASDYAALHIGNAGMHLSMGQCLLLRN